MPNIIDSYSETNQDDTQQMGATSVQRLGQCFTGDGEKIVDARWYLLKSSLPTGNAVAKIYTMTGTFGVNGNADALLATSDNVDVSTFGNTFALITFPFSGVNQYITTAGTHYVVSVEYFGGDGSNYIRLGYDHSAGMHPGNFAFDTGGGWTAADGSIDLCFYVDGVPVDVIVNLTGVSASPTIGSGTVTIESGVVPPIGFGEGIRIRRPRRKEEKIEIKLPPLPPPDIRVRAQGVSASVMIGAGKLNVQTRMAPLRYDQTEIDAQSLINLSLPLIGVPMPSVSLGQGAFNIGAELFPEEIAALIDSL